MDRRAFIGTLASSLLAAPLDAGAQEAGKVYRIGFLGVSSATDYVTNLQAFRQGLRGLGYEEGKNISIEYRWAEGRVERLPALAAELVRLNPHVLVTHATPGIRAAQQATAWCVNIAARGIPLRWQSWFHSGSNAGRRRTTQTDTCHGCCV